MRSNIAAALLTTTTAALIACGGETPPPAPPPAPPPPAEAPVAAAPTETTPPATPPKPPLADLIKVTMKTMREGFNGHDPAKMATVVTDDVTDFDYGAGERHGKAEFQAGMVQLFTMFNDARYATNRVWTKGNVLISELTWTGTMTGDVMGMKATNKPVGQMRLHIYWFNDDGLIKEVHEYADDAGLVAQMQGKKNAPPVPVLPTNPPEVHVAAGTPEEDKLADWAKSTDDGFNKDDLKATGAEMADDVDYWVSFSGMPATKGRKQLTKELGGWFKSFPDQKWTTNNAWGIDGFGIIEHTMTGTFKGPFGTVRPTGKQVTAWHSFDVMQPNSDGKIQHGWGYANAMEMLSQAGALPKPAETAAKGQAKRDGKN